MVACQLSQRAPSNAEYIMRVRKLFAASTKLQKILYLATDDSQAWLFKISRSKFDIIPAPTYLYSRNITIIVQEMHECFLWLI